MPKKKAGKKGAKIIDGVATNEMTREQLMAHVKRMQTELNREREERNFFMLEREKLYALWNITLEQLSAAKGESRLADVRMDDNERERQAEMHIYKQKLRFLLTEQSRRVAEVRLHNLHHMKALQESSSQVENSMRQTIDKKNRDIAKNQTSIYTMMRQLQLENAENSCKLRTQFCAELRRIESTFERLLYQREAEQKLQEASELQRTHQENSTHIQQLVTQHQAQLQEMKEFFNEITANNFAVIAALQEDLAHLRGTEAELKGQLGRAEKSQEKLHQAHAQEKQEAERRLKEDRKSAQESTRRLHQLDKRLKQSEKHARALEMKNAALEQKVEFVKRERDLLKETFTQGIVDMQKKSSMHKLILEMKLQAASRDLGSRPISRRGQGVTASGDHHDDDSSASSKQSAIHSQEEEEEDGSITMRSGEDGEGTSDS